MQIFKALFILLLLLNVHNGILSVKIVKVLSGRKFLLLFAEYIFVQSLLFYAFSYSEYNLEIVKIGAAFLLSKLISHKLKCLSTDTNS